MSRVSERLAELTDASKVMAASGLAPVPSIGETFWLVRRGTEKTGFEYVRVLDDGAVKFGALRGARRFDSKVDAMAVARRLMTTSTVTIAVISTDGSNAG